MLDAITCSEGGVPSTALITTPFRKLAQMTAANLGLADFQYVVAEHPIWTRDDAWFEVQAEKLADPVLKILQRS